MIERNLADVSSQLRYWAEQPPPFVRYEDRIVKTMFGERHGSWFLRFTWEDQLHRSVEAAITNATSLSDSYATEAYISIRAAASTEEGWTATMVYDRRRSLSRVSLEDFETWIARAFEVAQSYRPTSMTVGYPTFG